MWGRFKSAFKSVKEPVVISIFSQAAPQTLSHYERAFYEPPVSYAKSYPGVPMPEEPEALDLLAAQWVSNAIYPEKMPRIAADLLERGFDTPSLRRLAGEMQVSSIFDIHHLVTNMFAELGIHLPTSSLDAKLDATRQIARKVIFGMQNPWDAAAELERMWGYQIWRHAKLCDIAQLLESLELQSMRRNALPQLTADLVGVFAEIGKTADGQ